MSASDKEIARERMSKMMSDVDSSIELDELMKFSKMSKKWYQKNQ